MERKKWEMAMALVISMLALIPSAYAEAIIIDHNCTDLSQIPDEWIEKAKNLTIHYAHTSHGSQINSGLYVLEGVYSVKYSFARRVNTTEGLPPIEDPPALRMYDGNPLETYICPDDYWDGDGGIHRTRAVADTGNYNFSMWSWCGQVSGASESYIQDYLDTLNQFESEYTDMRFIHMTGHTDGTGESGNLNIRNNQIREYCIANDKVLFDFADIESYDPDGNYYLNRGVRDNCDYDGGNWADEWCAAHPDSDLCIYCSCAHSKPLNCNLKGRAFWWMMARLAGWVGISEDDVIYVPDDYTKIQWAVDNASIGDTIIVRDGTYPENVNVNKRLTIRAENGSGNCIVKASNPGNHVFEVTGSYVNISEFSITNATDFQKAGIYIDSVDHCNISDNHVSNNDFGIHLNNASSNTLQKNNASNNNCGILLDSASSNTITNNIANMNEQTNIALYSSSSNNTLTNNTALYSVNGIYLLEDSSNNTLTNNTVSENEYGICLFYSSCNNNLTGNTANSNTGELGGIYLWDSNGNTLTSNNVSNNSQYGIYLESSSSNTLSSNTVNSNSNYGIYLDDSNGNLIYNNYFNNTNNAWDDGTNVWNFTKEAGTNIINSSWLGGNYWSDYAGIDTDGDGLGDTNRPYNSSGGIQHGGDWHPLVEIMCGDVNCDGVVDMSDVIDLLYYVGYPAQYTICNQCAADVNCDKNIDMSDVIDLLYYVGYPGQYELKGCCM